jgi:hypothetical protein
MLTQSAAIAAMAMCKCNAQLHRALATPQRLQQSTSHAVSYWQHIDRAPHPVCDCIATHSAAHCGVMYGTSGTSS